jgi:hypothetical protein
MANRRTDEEEVAIRERDLVNHWNMFGEANCVEKLGSRWRLMFHIHPGLWRTKREAVEAGTNLVLEISRRRADQNRVEAAR